jgi:dipeptidyl aminopeptidase/acylaminoacyl peptidase
MATPQMNYSSCVSHPSFTTLSTNALQFNNEFGGRPWDPAALEASQKYNPAYTVAKWSTPQLTIHTSKDYRIPESDGIAAFHALQQCVFRFHSDFVLVHTLFCHTYHFFSIRIILSFHTSGG